ncbi:hypothetical protein BKA56DRAFT_607829 [Ilyonectria sp. MPI-CAGE-AT-0026]|nr:hypothetical protein BKA56DRAFT_607829 [Ilyonectria sp. MPI-CAGE-AT-0026]
MDGANYRVFVRPGMHSLDALHCSSSHCALGSFPPNPADPGGDKKRLPERAIRSLYEYAPLCCAPPVRCCAGRMLQLALRYDAVVCCFPQDRRGMMAPGWAGALGSDSHSAHSQRGSIHASAHLRIYGNSGISIFSHLHLQSAGRNGRFLCSSRLF